MRRPLTRPLAATLAYLRRLSPPYIGHLTRMHTTGNMHTDANVPKAAAATRQRHGRVTPCVGEAAAAAHGRQRLLRRLSAVARQRLHGIDGTEKEHQEQGIDGACRAHMRHRCCSAKRQRPRPRSGRACQRSPRCSTRRTGCRLPVTHGRRKRE